MSPLPVSAGVFVLFLRRNNSAFLNNTLTPHLFHQSSTLSAYKTNIFSATQSPHRSDISQPATKYLPATSIHNAACPCSVPIPIFSFTSHAYPRSFIERISSSAKKFYSPTAVFFLPVLFSDLVFSSHFPRLGTDAPVLVTLSGRRIYNIGLKSFSGSII